MKNISLIVPCFNEEEAIPLFYEEALKCLKEISDIDYEIIFVDDGSKDKTLYSIKKLRENDKRVKYISFSRNFGKEAAMYAGINESCGDYVAIMDVDLQDPPSLLKEMIEILSTSNFDSVATRRVSRKGEPVIRSFFAKCYYKLINKISDTEIVDGARDFRLMTRQMVDSILEMGEYNRFTKGIFSWVGYNTKWLEYENIERVAGTTKWSFWKLFIYSIESIVAFSTKPLIIASVIGFLMCIVAIALIIFIILRTSLYGDPTSGWPSMICVIFLVGGLQMLCVGIIGEYLAKTYLEVKRRPLYIAKDKTTTKEKDKGKVKV